MIGTRYWSTGIVIERLPYGKWSAHLDFHDDGFCVDDSTEGMLRARYLVDDLDRVIDVLREDAERLGIEFRDPILNQNGIATIYVKGDGEDLDGDTPEGPGLREIANTQARRLGWNPAYSSLGPLAGQTWRSRDPRDEGLTVTILEVDDERVHIKRFRKSSVRRDRFTRDYEFVSQ